MRVKTIADPDVLASLIDRLQAIDASAARRWGTLTPHEMLCHLGDATAMVLGDRPRTVPIAPRGRAIVRALMLWSPVPWPHGVPTNPRSDPRAEGTRPSDFGRDRDRAVDGLRRLAAPSGPLEPVHGIFGAMSAHAWQRWAYKHTDLHLRQFGG